MKLRFRASHNRTTALRVSHHGNAWEPPVKDVDREDAPAQARRNRKK